MPNISSHNSHELEKGEFFSCVGQLAVPWRILRSEKEISQKSTIDLYNISLFLGYILRVWNTCSSLFPWYHYSCISRFHCKHCSLENTFFGMIVIEIEVILICVLFSLIEVLINTLYEPAVRYLIDPQIEERVSFRLHTEMCGKSTIRRSKDPEELGSVEEPGRFPQRIRISRSVFTNCVSWSTVISSHL